MWSVELPIYEILQKTSYRMLKRGPRFYTIENSSEIHLKLNARKISFAHNIYSRRPRLKFNLF